VQTGTEFILWTCVLLHYVIICYVAAARLHGASLNKNPK